MLLIKFILISRDLYEERTSYFSNFPMYELRLDKERSEHDDRDACKCICLVRVYYLYFNPFYLSFTSINILLLCFVHFLHFLLYLFLNSYDDFGTFIIEKHQLFAKF